ncbi:MAG: hypothetical protein IKH15_01275 [Bacteroidales bacterium]|nr:hypothetical protein [Bacteroidales bacterium]
MKKNKEPRCKSCWFGESEKLIKRIFTGYAEQCKKSKLEWLPDDDCRTLSTKFDFSGGEIDNIVRKVVMEEVLHGTRPTLAEIEELCRHEKIGQGSSGGSIGFQA